MGLLHLLPNQSTNCTIFPGFKVIDTLLFVVQYRGNLRGQLSRIEQLAQPFFVAPLFRIGVMLALFLSDLLSHFTLHRAIANLFNHASQVFRCQRNVTKLRVFGILVTEHFTH